MTSKLIAAVLEAEFGEARYVQIGLFEDGKTHIEELPAAQQRFVSALVAALQEANAPGSRVLLAGSALGQLSQALAANAVHTLWLGGTEANPGAIPACDFLKIESQTLLDAVLTESFDCIVIVGTYRYLDQLALFSRSRELLQIEGKLFVVGEFLQDDSQIELSSLANLSSQRQLAERLGYRNTDRTDLTASALQSVQLFSVLLEKHITTVTTTLQLADSAAASLVDLFSTMQKELETGRRCFQLQQWQLQDSLHNDRLGEYAKAEYGDIGSFELAEISNLFEQSFEKAFDAELWRWKYQFGDGKCVIARIERHGEIVAHYGGAPRKISYFGKPSMAIQVCDVMVLPEKRRQYGKSSLFFKVAATFLEREIGNTVNHLLGFGFPNQSAMNIATRLGLYEKTDDFVEVVYANVMSSARSATCTALDINDRTHQQLLEQCWQQMVPDFAQAIIGQRDWRYIKYRYFDHPGANNEQYRCLLLRNKSSDEMLALVVLKQHEGNQLLMDMVCPLAQISEVISEVNQLVKEGSPQADLRVWITRGWLHTFPMEGAIVNELGIEIPCNSWNPGPSSVTLYGKWWLTAGDMDFM